MRHEQIDGFSAVAEADLASVWPKAGDFAPAAAIAPTAAAPDVPASVGKLLIGVYGTLIGVFAATLGGSKEAAFMIAISGLYVAIYCAVPWIFFRVEKDAARRPDMAEFMRKGLDTWTGHTSGPAALVQMLIVPVMLTFCVLCIGITALFVL